MGWSSHHRCAWVWLWFVPRTLGPALVLELSLHRLLGVTGVSIRATAEREAHSRGLELDEL